MVEQPPRVVYRELKSPVTAQMELTARCNNLCLYCYNSFRGDKEQHPGLQLEDSLRIARQLADNEVFEVILTGGEPLYRRDLVYPVASFLSSECVDVKLNTNLTLLKEEDVSRIKDSGILAVFGSFSSQDEGTYNRITQTKNYKRVVRGLEILVASGIPLGVNMVVTKLNEGDVYKTGEFLHNLGINIFCATPASPCQYMPKEIELSRESVVATLDSLLRLKEDFGMNVDVVEPLPRCMVQDSRKYEFFFRRDCAAGKLTVSISPNGDVHPCTHVLKSYGNLLTQDLPSIWRSMSDWRNGSYIPSGCNLCSELEICSLGCREAGRIKEGSHNSPDPWAQNPLRVNRRVDEDVPINEEANLRIPDKIKYRKEGNNYAVYCSNTHSVILINLEFFNLIKNLYSRENFTIKSLTEEMGDEIIVKNTINFLNTRGLIC